MPFAVYMYHSVVYFIRNNFYINQFIIFYLFFSQDIIIFLI